MSLLTDENIKDLTATWHVQHTTPQYRKVADASQTVTLKAVAEWLLDNCGWDGHGNRLIYYDFRNSKGKRQLVNWLANLCEGKMPGEE